MKKNKTLCENVCLLVRRLILNGEVRQLVLVKNTGDGTFEFSSFSGETEHTIFIDDTLAVVDDSYLSIDLEQFNLLNYSQLEIFFIVQSISANNATHKCLMILCQGDVKPFTNFSRP